MKLESTFFNSQTHRCMPYANSDCTQAWLPVGCCCACIPPCLQLSGVVSRNLIFLSWAHDTRSSLADNICISMKWNLVPLSVPDSWQFILGQKGAKVTARQTIYKYNWLLPHFLHGSIKKLQQLRCGSLEVFIECILQCFVYTCTYSTVSTRFCFHASMYKKKPQSEILNVSPFCSD